MARLEELTRSASFKGILPNQNVMVVHHVAAKARGCNPVFEDNGPIRIEEPLAGGGHPFTVGRRHHSVPYPEERAIQLRAPYEQITALLQSLGMP